ncbi:MULTISPECIES: hypothetical protein [unclassified Moorena]|uniref:hypothetical protein n=1 Tax=unclassified Moorena TaxID=2683338 RepID=UPI0013C559D4|nr:MULTISPECIES: hypothetical protein [unclassified Moorena]NEO19982.1 hypothetical protein [Moorena sp. SIO4A5]NEQ59443.1 hypothetical protein [Moorena sp. SIO4A1]
MITINLSTKIVKYYHCSLFPVPCSLFPTPYSLLPTPYFLIINNRTPVKQNQIPQLFRIHFRQPIFSSINSLFR